MECVCLHVCRGELGTKENAAAMSSANVYANSSGDVLNSGTISHPRTSSHTSSVLHSNQSEDVEEHLQKDQGESVYWDLLCVVILLVIKRHAFILYDGCNYPRLRQMRG